MEVPKRMQTRKHKHTIHGTIPLYFCRNPWKWRLGAIKANVVFILRGIDIKLFYIECLHHPYIESLQIRHGLSRVEGLLEWGSPKLSTVAYHVILSTQIVSIVWLNCNNNTAIYQLCASIRLLHFMWVQMYDVFITSVDSYFSKSQSYCRRNWRRFQNSKNSTAAKTCYGIRLKNMWQYWVQVK